MSETSFVLVRATSWWCEARSTVVSWLYRWPPAFLSRYSSRKWKSL